LYAYAANNPVRYIDPDGYSFLGKVLGYGCYVAAGIVVVAGTAVAITTGGTTTPVLAPAAASFAGKLAITGTVILATDSTYEIAAEARSNAASRKRHKSSASAALPKNGAASAAAGSPNSGQEHDDKESNPKKASKMQQEVKKGKAPKSVDRVDKGKGPYEKDHVHFRGNKNTESALNKDGTWKHGSKTLTNEEKDWLLKNGWKIPQE